METKLVTCHHLYDDGGKCNSAAVTDRNYCTYHLRYRARQLRMAQSRARNQRFDLKLPPLESMYAVQSALTQLAEALAADMIEPKRAQALLSVLRLASLNLRHPEKWQATLYHADQPGPAVDLAAEFGLPHDLDLDTPPDVAFPLAPESATEEGCPALVRQQGGQGGNELPAKQTDNWPPATDNCFFSPMPTLAYCKDGPGCPEHTIRADFPFTPETVELHEVLETEGQDAATLRYKQQQKNRHRRYLRSDRKRYAALALEKNLRLAADRLAERKLAEKEALEKLAAKKPAASVESSETFAAKEAATA